MTEQTNVSAALPLLACPATKLPLVLCTAEQAEARMGARLAARKDSVNAKGVVARPHGVTPSVLLREDLRVAYPVVDGIPILLVPEMLVPEGQEKAVDLRDPKYAEAYEEMEFYNRVATEEAEHITDADCYRVVEPVLRASAADRASFPAPRSVWIDTIYDAAAQSDCYRHLAPIQGKRILQVGGKGSHAVKFALGGAAEGWAMSPMLGEMRCAQTLARAVGVADRFRCVVGIGEEMPFVSGAMDALYMGGCLHHMCESLALAESARVLRAGGAFAAAEPWRAPLYALGTRLLGKREPDVYCRPMTPKRLEPFSQLFPGAEFIHHGALTRYVFLGLNKFGLRFGQSAAWHANALDDTVSSLVPGLRHAGSSLALLARKP